MKLFTVKKCKEILKEKYNSAPTDWENIHSATRGLKSAGFRGFPHIPRVGGIADCSAELFRGQDPPIPQAWYRRPKLHMRMLTHAVCAYFPKILLGKHLPAPLKSFTCLFAPLCCAYVLAQFETDVICAGSRVFPRISAEIRILRTRKLSNGFAAE